MPVKAILFFCAASAAGQPYLSLLATPGYPGKLITVNVVLAGSIGANIVGLDWDAPAGTGPSFLSQPLGTASVLASKSMVTVQNAGSGIVRVSLVGIGLPVVPPTNPSQPVPNYAYNDGIVASFTYQIPITAPLGMPMTLQLANATATTSDFNVISLGVPSITILAGINANCVALLGSSATSYKALPSQLAMLAFETRLAAALSTGTCQ